MNFGIIAAGEGSRLAGEGAAACKPMIELCGKPMIGRLLHLMASCGAKRVAMILNPAMPEVLPYVRGLEKELDLTLDIIVKSTPSSMHSFYEISSLLRGHGRFITTTVDTVFRPEAFRRYAKMWQEAPENIDGMMAMTRYIDDEKPLYIDTDWDNEPIRAFRDEAWPGAKYISGGIYGLDSKAIGVLQQCMDEGVSRMRNYQRRLLSAGLTLLGHDMGKILDVDHISDIPKAEAFLRQE